MSPGPGSNWPISHLSRPAWALAISLAFLNWLGDAACLAFAIKAARQTVPVRHLLLVWSAGSGAATFGFTPGGVGVVEVALVAALVASGITAAGAAVAVLIYRLISLWLSLAVGWILFLFVRRPQATRDSPDSAAAASWTAIACRPDLTSEELGKQLRRQLGPRFRITEPAPVPAGADHRGSHRPETLMVSLRPARQSSRSEHRAPTRRNVHLRGRRRHSPPHQFRKLGRNSQKSAQRACRKLC